MYMEPYEESKAFVIYLSSVEDFGCFNSYGYYLGKTKVKARERYPLTLVSKYTKYIKIYLSKSKAERAAKKIADKCDYVVAYRIEELCEI